LSEIPTWAVWLTASVVVAALSVLGVVLLTKKLQNKEPYSEIMRLRTRQKIRFFRYMATDGRVPKRVKFVPFLLALYLAMPFDLIPDFIPVLGYVDDVGVIIVAMIVMVKLTPPETIAAILERLNDGTSDDLPV